MTKSNTTISVYLDDGRVFSYDIDDPNKAREHSSAIIATGYRHTENDKGIMEHFPPHRISKIKCVGNMATKYSDKVIGT